jgi:hypothetical protein
VVWETGRDKVIGVLSTVGNHSNGKPIGKTKDEKEILYERLP